MPTRRRWRCWTPARARPRRPTSGPRREANYDPQPGVVYEFCLGRGAQYPVAFLGGEGPPGSATRDQPAWHGTLMCDQYAGYDAVLDERVYPDFAGPARTYIVYGSRWVH